MSFRNDTLSTVVVDDDKITNKRALVTRKTRIYSLNRIKLLYRSRRERETRNATRYISIIKYMFI